MSYATDRVQLFDRDMNPLRELAPNEVFSRKRTEEVNGEHELVITTTRKLEEGWRALTVDGTGKWREWVVTEIDEDHSSGKTAMGTYRFVWSLQYDLTYSYAHTFAELGYGPVSVSASEAAGMVLEGVPNWSVGNCDAAGTDGSKGAVLIYESAWSKLSKVVECLDCEVEAEIEVSNLYGVRSRKLCLVAHVGNEEAVRRFDWGEDLLDIKRTPDPGPYYCRLVPLGKGDTEYAADDETTFEWPLDITDETGDPNLYYVEDAEAAQTFRIKLPDGTFYYPTVAVHYDEDDPELLLYAAQDDLHNYTRPGVTYEANVAQFSKAGMDVHGVALGDEVQCVDSGFNEDAPLRIQGRVIKIEVDELSPETTMQLTIGQLRDDMSSIIAELDATFNELASQNTRIRANLAEMTTSRYIDELLRRINNEINATGGYAYFVTGEGIITYDTAVSDPLVGSEATQVVQIKGGSIRIANSKKSGFAGIDDWDWKTVFISGHVLADLVTAAKLTSGYIGNATNSSFWDIDNGDLRLRYAGWESSGYRYTQNMFVGKVLDATATQAWWLAQYSITGNTYPLYGAKFSLNKNLIDSAESTSGNDISYIGVFAYGRENQQNVNSIGSSHGLVLASNLESSNGLGSVIELTNNGIRLSSAGRAPYEIAMLYNGIKITATQNNTVLETTIDANGCTFTMPVVFAYRKTVTFDGTTTFNGSSEFTASASFDSSVSASYGIDIGNSTTSATRGLRCYGPAYFYGTLSCSGTVASNIKSRLVKTADYGDRLLFCYETPTPLFGDVGSAATDENGEALISIDDMFAETARTDFTYQVFLQKCGDGDLWVKEKHPNYFIVQGTPNLAFDWEIKARQVDNENIRLEDFDRHMSQEQEPRELVANLPDIDKSDIADIEAVTRDMESVYSDYIDIMEAIYDDERAVA